MDSRPPLRRFPRASPGLPGPSTRLSSRALPNHPEQPDACIRSLLPHRWQASASPAEWPLLLVSRGRIRFACAGLATSLITTVLCRAPGCIARPDRSVSRRRLPFYAGPELHAERAIHMADTSQSARRIRVTLVHRRNGEKSSRERGLSRSPSSNRTCRFPASGSPTRVVIKTYARS
jgi:hypothetical protein